MSIEDNTAELRREKINEKLDHMFEHEGRIKLELLGDDMKACPLHGIVLEGSDGTGKTTLANKLIEKINKLTDLYTCTYMNLPWHYSHLGPINKAARRGYKERSYFYKPDDWFARPIVQDRWFMSDYVYSKLNNLEDQMSPLELINLMQQLRDYTSIAKHPALKFYSPESDEEPSQTGNILTVVLTAEDSLLKERHAKNAENELFGASAVCRANDLYIQARSFLTEDVNPFCLWFYVFKDEENDNKIFYSRDGAPCSYRGYLRLPVMDEQMDLETLSDYLAAIAVLGSDGAETLLSNASVKNE